MFNKAVHTQARFRSYRGVADTRRHFRILVLAFRGVAFGLSPSSRLETLPSAAHLTSSYAGFGAACEMALRANIDFR
jgi:hypothetical protein